MKRFILLLLLLSGLLISGCVRQTPPENANKSSQSTPPVTASAPAKKVSQISLRFKEFSPDSKLFVVGFWHGDAGVLPGSLEIWNASSHRKTGEIQFDAPVRTAVFFLPKIRYW